MDLNVNVNEVKDTNYVSQTEFRDMLGDQRVRFTPWLQLICEGMLFGWWDSLIKGGLELYEGVEEIRRMT